MIKEIKKQYKIFSICHHYSVGAKLYVLSIIVVGCVVNDASKPRIYNNVYSSQDNYFRDKYFCLLK